MLFQLPLPHFVDTAVDNLGACTSPMAMALVGAILADVPLKTVFDPGASTGGGAAVPAAWHLSGSSALLGIGSPHHRRECGHHRHAIGSTTAILAQKYGADAQFASKCVFISTLTSLVTVPILTLFL